MNTTCITEILNEKIADAKAEVNKHVTSDDREEYEYASGRLEGLLEALAVVEAYE